MENFSQMVLLSAAAGVIVLLSSASAAVGTESKSGEIRQGGANLTLAAIQSTVPSFQRNSTQTNSNATSLFNFLVGASSLVANRTGRNYGGGSTYGDRHDTYSSGSGWGASGGVKRYGSSGGSNYYKSDYKNQGSSQPYKSGYGDQSNGGFYGGDSNYGSSGGSGYGGSGYGGGFYGKKPYPVPVDNIDEILPLLLLLNQRQNTGVEVAAPADDASGGIGGLIAAGVGLLPLLGSTGILGLGTGSVLDFSSLFGLGRGIFG